MSTNMPSLFPLPPADAPVPPVVPRGALTVADELLLDAQPEEVRALVARLLESEKEDALTAKEEYERGKEEGYDEGYDQGKADALRELREQTEDTVDDLEQVANDMVRKLRDALKAA